MDEQTVYNCGRYALMQLYLKILGLIYLEVFMAGYFNPLVTEYKFLEVQKQQNKSQLLTHVNIVSDWSK